MKTHHKTAFTPNAYFQAAAKRTVNEFVNMTDEEMGTLGDNPEDTGVQALKAAIEKKMAEYEKKHPYRRG